MQYKESDVITIMFSNGMELIGKLVNEDGGGVVVNRPMLCQATEKGVAFSPAITLTGEAVDENLSIKKTNILYIVKTIKENSGIKKKLSGIKSSLSKECLIPST